MGTLTGSHSIVSMVAGTLFCVWLGELITEYGIGNGISIIIFGGIVAGFWQVGIRRYGYEYHWFNRVCCHHSLYHLVYSRVHEAHRRIPVQYARSVFRAVGCTGRAVRHISRFVLTRQA